MFELRSHKRLSMALQKKEMIIMHTVSYGDVLVSDTSENEFRSIDCECSACLYEAGRLALSDALAAVIRNELTQTEQTAIRLHWFERQRISRIAAVTGVSDDAVRKTVKRAEKKIYQSLKYVVLYNELIGKEDKLPDDFRFKIVRCIDGKELIA